MPHTTLDYHFLSIADLIFVECNKIPSHVKSCECKNKRKLREALYKLAEAAFIAGCSRECNTKLANGIQSWLASGKIPESLVIASTGINDTSMSDMKRSFSEATPTTKVTALGGNIYLLEMDSTPVNVQIFRRRYFFNDGRPSIIIEKGDEPPTPK